MYELDNQEILYKIPLDENKGFSLIPQKKLYINIISIFHSVAKIETNSAKNYDTIAAKDQQRSYQLITGSEKGRKIIGS